MSTVIIINPPKRPERTTAEAEQVSTDQLLKDVEVLRQAGYTVQVYHTTK